MKKHLALAVAGLSLVCGAGSANAALQLDTTVPGGYVSVVNGGAPRAHLYDSNPTPVSWSSVLVTPQWLHGVLGSDPVTLFAYCIDIYQASGRAKFDVVDLSTLLSPTRYSLMANLIFYQGAQTSAAHDAAVQLAVWELMDESTGTLDVGANDFHVTTATSGLIGTANSYLSDAIAHSGEVHPGLTLYAATDPCKQDFLFWTYTPPAVPEPASWAMMIGGLGLVGGMMRRSRARADVRFA